MAKSRAKLKTRRRAKHVQKPRSRKESLTHQVRQMSVYIDGETLNQIDQLGSALKSSHSSVIRQAVARWYHDEPLLKRIRRMNGQVLEVT